MLPQRKKFTINAMPEPIDSTSLAALEALDTGTIGHYLEAGFADPGLTLQTTGRKIAGTAVTVRSTLPDSVLVHYALKFVRQGDILVVDRGQDQRTACWGAATSYGAVAAGLTGLMRILRQTLGVFHDAQD